MYPTGDLCRHFPDGNIEFIGRVDHQIKIRGYRIELGEIESVLCGHPALSGSAVVVQHDDAAEKRLAAFIVSKAGLNLSVDILRAWLRAQLPDYMIPDRFIVLETLPLTTNGKLDRKALESMHGIELPSGVPYTAPRTPLEQELAVIWTNLLKRERVGIHDNFFSLGGHSLSAVVLCSRIASVLHIEVPLRWIFEHSTVQQLARKLETMETCPQSGVPLEKTARQRFAPMSFPQQGMWLLTQTLENEAAYNVPLAWRFSGSVNAAKLQRSLQALLGRHEVLRTGLTQVGEELFQEIFAESEIELPWRELNLQTFEPDQKSPALEAILLEEASRPFHLAKAPLWRSAWVTLSADEQVLALTFHHSILDEWSLRLLLEELERVYAVDGDADEAQLPKLELQYADYAAWQRKHQRMWSVETQKDYWRQQLQNLPPVLSLPTDKKSGTRLTGQGAIHDFRIARPLANSLRDLARTEGSSLFTMMLAAFQTWLHRYSGQTDLVIGTPFTKRDRSELQSMLGFFLIPSRSALDSMGLRRSAMY